MIVLGLAGPAGSGKDTVALYLQERYGFVPFSFSDALYREVAQAFGLDDDSLLRDRETKELRDRKLSLVNCYETGFIDLVEDILRGDTIGPEIEQWNSPRQILQWWGTQYRRAQDPDYWVKKADEWIDVLWSMYPYPELRPQKFVNTSVRFPNEQAWCHEFTNGNVWHLHRDAATPVAAHESETPLPVLPGERELWNNYTLEYLHMGVDQLMTRNIPSIRIEPPEPMRPR